MPEIASRQHVRDICGVVERALGDAGVDWPGVDAIAVTQGPGLIGSLLVGVSFAKATAVALERPVVAVHHLAGHIESIFLEHGAIPMPAPILVVSGGHTSLYFVEDPGQYQLIGRTRDDAAGEAYDKVARLLGLGYPGGPVIDRRAKAGRDDAVALPRPKFTHRDRKRAGRRRPSREVRLAARRIQFLRAEDGRRPGARGTRRPRRAGICGARRRGAAVATMTSTIFARASSASWSSRWSIARSTPRAQLGARSVGIAGGVSANSRLRRDAVARGAQAGVPVFVPPIALSTDNAAMIAAAGLRKIERGAASALDFNALATLDIDYAMRVHTDYLWFNTKQRQEFVRITDDVAKIVAASGVDEGMVLVSAMHITAAVYVNDWEDGLISDFQSWLEKLAPAGLPYRHHQTGEDNADAHLKRTLMGHQVMLPITKGRLDLGPWEQVFYAEFDGQRKKRVVVKVMGE